ncbi:MAG: bifunctional diaminohydroxyphosphoribosylaminopyrimidine deaminase/5-amino-6-(5-phosphoribosylamino)uracil reductase RibD [Anaerolineae bacterium]
MLARKAEGFTSPNPMVGAVVVREGEIVGKGYHHRAGEAHAEINALREAGDKAYGATLYVTLEPCNHHGRTPPCTEAILASGITEVVYAVPDPNPPASGGGHRLREAGLAVISHICHDEAYDLNRFFFHRIRTKRPYVIAKFASSLDGKIATYEGHSQWITGEAARERAHQLRHAVDAIMVGTDTAITDNPRLTTRLPIKNPKHPLRILLDSRGRIPLDHKLFSPDLPGETLVATTDAMPKEHEQQLREQGTDVLRLPANGWKQVNLEALLDALGTRNLQSLMVEGGAQLLGALFDADLIDEVWAFIAPILFGGGQDAPSAIGGFGIALVDDAPRLKNMHIERLGDDILIRGQLKLSVAERDR